MIFGQSRSLALAAFLSVAACTSASAEELTIEGVGISRDVPCDGSDVGVYGASNEIHLTGTCGNIIVHGHAHKVTFETGKALAVSGMEHKVSGGEVGTLSVDTSDNEVKATIRAAEGEAAVEVAGANNRLTLEFAGASVIGVNGVENTVDYALAGGAPKPKISSTGTGHAIKAK